MTTFRCRETGGTIHFACACLQEDLARTRRLSKLYHSLARSYKSEAGTYWRSLKTVHYVMPQAESLRIRLILEKIGDLAANGAGSLPAISVLVRQALESPVPEAMERL